jgi:hypothetical protein
MKTSKTLSWTKRLGENKNKHDIGIIYTLPPLSEG